MLAMLNWRAESIRGAARQSKGGELDAFHQICTADEITGREAP
jgi:hypothetical protein